MRPLGLREKQALFTITLATLLQRLYEQGYEVTLGEAWRPPEMAEVYAAQGKGIANSLHGDRLAVDLNLFRGGIFLTADDAEDWATIGALWKGLNPLCAWGGDFTSRDYGHFSFRHAGRA